jgi:hypothetical protein
MNKALLIAVVATMACGLSQVTWADDSSSNNQNSIKLDDAKDQKNKVPGDNDADQILTNNKLRAETGSKSRWSVGTSLGYDGGSISRPFADTRPNIQNVNGNSPVSDIAGGVSVKFNLNQQNSLLLGETVRYVTPFSANTPGSYRGQKLDNYNPSLNFQHIYKLAGLQSYYQVGPTIYTQSDYTNIGYLGNLGIYNVNAYDIGHSKVTIGLESGLSYNWFRSPQAYPEFKMSIDDTKEQSSDYTAFVYPYLEYAFNDKVNLRTVCMFFSVEHTLANNGDYNRWTKDKAMQSVGIGISVTRDIFLYPNVQFIPDELRGKQTNVSLSSNINIF